jgi:hypothetical protein
MMFPALMLIIKLGREDRRYYRPTSMEGVRKILCFSKATFLVNRSLCKHFSHTFSVPSMLMRINFPKVDMNFDSRCYPRKEGTKAFTSWQNLIIENLFAWH